MASLIGPGVEGGWARGRCSEWTPEHRSWLAQAEDWRCRRGRGAAMRCPVPAVVGAIAG